MCKVFFVQLVFFFFRTARKECFSIYTTYEKDVKMTIFCSHLHKLYIIKPL